MVANAGITIRSLFYNTFIVFQTSKFDVLQQQKPIGSTIVPILGSSDQTHLTNYSGDKKEWPVFLSLGNIRSSERLKATRNCNVLVALLPVPPKHSFRGPGKTAETKAQQDYNREVLRQVFEKLFTPLNDLFHTGKRMICSDGQVRHCFPVICGWTADYFENVNLHSIQSGFCHVCEAPKSSFGSTISAPAPYRDYPDYFQRLIQANNPADSKEEREAAIQYLTERGARTREGVFWAFECFDWTSALVPDVLHTIYLGLLKHLMDWLVPFLEHHKRMTVFNQLWSLMPPYPGFSPFRKPYTAIVQWQGKEFKMLGRTLLPILGATLHNPTADQRGPFREAILCVKGLIFFHLMAKYHSHTDRTIGYMERYLEDFHHHKEVFARFRANKMTKKSALELRHELSEELKTARETADDWYRLSNAAKTRRVEEDRQIVEYEVDQHLADESDFNFVKMHLPVHFRESIRQLGHLSNLTAEYYEHEMIDIKDAYRRSNKNDASEQILRTKARREYFKYRNMEHDVQMRRLDDGSIPNPQPPLRRFQGKRLGITTLQELARWCELPVGTLQNLIAWCLKRFDLFTGYADSDDAFPRLSEAKYTSYAAAVLPVTSFQGDEVEKHVVRCTGSEPSRKNKSPRNDNVLLWPDREVEGNFASTQGRIPARLLCFFHLDESYFGVQACLALVRTLVPGPKRQPLGMVTVTEKETRTEALDEINVRRRPHTGVGTRYIVPLRAIERAAHLCPLANDVDNNRWFINSTIDLNAFNLLEE